MTDQFPTRGTSQTPRGVMSVFSLMTYEQRVDAAALFEIEMGGLLTQHITSRTHQVCDAELEYDLAMDAALRNREIRVDAAKARCLQACNISDAKRVMGVLREDQALTEICDACDVRDSEIRDIKTETEASLHEIANTLEERRKSIQDFFRIMAHLRREIRAKKYRELQLPLPN